MMTKFTPRRILALFCLAVLLLAAGPVSARAAEPETVKVGYYQSDGFQDGASEDAVKTGYSYEYLQKLAYVTGWQYEYVYGDWAELYDKFLLGDIDILAGVSYTEERASQILYPDTCMGTENYYLYKHESDTAISADDLTTLNGKTVGGVKNNLITTCVEAWTEEQEIDLTIEYFDSFDICNEAFYAGEIDCVAATDNNVSADSKMSPLVRVGGSDYYLAVAKNRSDLLDKLNEAQRQINNTEPYFRDNLQYKYFGKTAVGIALSAEESEWIEQHHALHIGYIVDYNPFCWQDESGSAAGILTDIIDQWMTEMALEDTWDVHYVAYDTYEDMLVGLNAGEIDVIFPESDSIWYSEQNNIHETTAVISVPLSLIFSGDSSDGKLERIAISGHSPMQRMYTETYYPDSEQIEVNSAEECLNAILNGSADSTLFTSYRAEAFLAQSKYSSLRYVSLDSVYSYCLGVRKGDTVLLSLLNKGLSRLDSTALSNKMFSYVNYQKEYTLSDFARDNILLVLGVIALFFSVVVLGLLLYLSGIKNAQYETQIQLEKNRQLTQSLEEARARAEAANVAKTAFLFNMSHDIRTPMNAIIGFTELLERHRGEPERALDCIQKIKTSSQFLLSLINNVLEMARIESGNITLEESPWSAEQLNDSLFSVFDVQMRSKNITFARTLDVTHHYFLCDPIKLRQVYLNILSNALKYTPAGGSVAIVFRELPSDRDGYALYETTVSDTGVGMSPDFLPRLFDEFSREHTATESKVEGTGLGMPIVKQLIERMGGTIEVESELGHGTTFRVRLSHKIADESALLENEPAPLETTSFAGKRLLLAEDNDLNAEIAMEILKEAGFGVDRAADGQLCVDMLTQAEPGHYSAVLMDIQMPNMNGYEATKAIRILPDVVKAGIPIIAMTANAFEEDRQNSLAAGMNAHIAKPIEIPKLLAILSDFLR